MSGIDLLGLERAIATSKAVGEGIGNEEVHG